MPIQMKTRRVTDRSTSRSSRRGRSTGRKSDGRSSRLEPRHLTYSKWIDSSDDHEERKGQLLATLNHDVIRKWAEPRKGIPSAVNDTEGRDGPGVLHIDFPDYGGKRLKRIDWNEWFDTFHKRQLVFLYQEHKQDGSISTFYKLATK